MVMSEDSSPGESYRFGEFTLDTVRGALLRNNAEVRLRPQSFEVLSHLVRNSGRLVSKEELHAAIWSGKAVTDDSLTQCLTEIRKALRDKDRTIVRTVPRRGYVFEDAVEIGQSALAGERQVKKPAAPGRWLLLAIGAIAVVVSAWLYIAVDQPPGSEPIEHSIAILPLVDMSASQDQQHLGDGLSEDILIALAQNSNLRVIARTSSFNVVERSSDIAAIRDALNVAYVLEGSVRRNGESVRVTAQLIDTSDSTQIWSQSFDTQLVELLSVPLYIAEEVQRQILPAESVVAVEKPRRLNSAYELMLLARDYERRVREQPEVDEASLQRSISLYREATEANPDSALAHSRLAAVLLYAGEVSAAEPHVFRALSLDPDHSEVQETVGRFFWARNLPEAGAAWKRATELNPNNADALSSYAYWHWIRVSTDGPEEYFRRALQLDPLSLSRYADLGYFLGNEGRVDDTLAVIAQVENLFDSAESCRLIAQLLSLIGRDDESIAWILRARAMEPDNSLHRAALAELYADIGDFDTALLIEPEPGLGLLLKMRRYDEFIEIAEFRMIDEPRDIYLRYLLAYAYNVTGRPIDAIRILENAGIKGEWRTMARQMIDIEAAVTYTDAVHASGDIAHGRSLAEAWLSTRHTRSTNWWVHLYSACALAVLDRDDEALDELDRIYESPRLPWPHLLQSSRCFQKYVDEPRYQAVLRHVQERQAALRAKLPKTLERFGVAL